ncbi:spore germination protein [Clostridium oryzae]|uniref:Spore germination protein A1 n=1 Tax=Clostridium oryzae TaxID=1450648 RepID=A0A1V4IK20_9CLOT|nr:spore germination protein [Clostridium oryzae]OPJ60095.1 spore germination protein A1 [Clostridium oryzae]
MLDIDLIKKELKENFDVKHRIMNLDGNDIHIIFIDNMCDSKFISQNIMNPIINYNQCIADTDTLKKRVLYANNIDDIDNEAKAIEHILSGDVIIILSNTKQGIFCEAKGFAKRSIAIPETEAVLQGPREGFNESITDNISMIRRRIKNDRLKLESYTLGKKSNTMVIFCYLDGTAPDRLINYVRNTLNNINNDFILDTAAIEEALVHHKSLFDLTGRSEKPDVVASKIMEGRIAVLVDGTPNVLTAPYFFVENFQTPDDYYINKYYASMSRLIRWGAFFIATLLTGFYIAITTYHFSLIPTVFVFRLAVSRSGVPFPTSVEVLLMFLFFQLIKEAGIRLPQPIGQAMSIVGALILGDAATGAGITSQTTVLVVSLSSICYFLVPKLYGAITFWSLVLVFMASINGLPGYFVGFFLMVTQISSLESCQYNYLFPMGTFRKFKYRDVIFRDDLRNISKKVL